MIATGLLMPAFPALFSLCRQGEHWRFDLEVFDVTTGVGGVLWTGALVASTWLLSHPQVFHGKRCLELGAGTGLLGLTAAQGGASHVLLTDWEPELLLGLESSILRHGLGSAGRLDWFDPDAGIGRFGTILGAEVIHEETTPYYHTRTHVNPRFYPLHEVIYNESHGDGLAATLELLLECGGKGYIVSREGRLGVSAFLAAVETKTGLCLVGSHELGPIWLDQAIEACQLKGVPGPPSGTVFHMHVVARCCRDGSEKGNESPRRHFAAAIGC